MPPSEPRSTSPTGMALLGLLSLRPWTTYELTKQVRRSLGWFWPRAERRLYDEPKKLAAAGLATASEEQTGKRPRTVYAITPEGRAALREWLDEPSVPPAFEFEAMVRVFFADAGTLDQLRTTLERVEQAALEREARLQAMVAERRDDTGEFGGEFGGRRAVNALSMRFHLDHERHLAEWAAWARDQVETWNSPTDPGDWDPDAAIAPARAGD